MSCVAMNIQTLESVCLGNQVWPEPQRAKKKRGGKHSNILRAEIKRHEDITIVNSADLIRM